MTRLIVRHQNLLTCVALVAWVLFTFDDVVLRGLNLAFAGLDTGVPNDDAKVLLYPFFDHFLTTVKESGRIDPWNPYIWGGTPAIGNPNVPFNALLYGLFHLSKPDFLLAMNWHLVLEFVLCAVGLFLLCRKLGLSWWQSVLAPLLCVHSASAAWLTNTFCVFFHWAVIPWALLILMTRERRSSFTTVVFLGALFYFQITYGQAQMTVYTGLFLFACAAWIFRESLGRGSLKPLALGYLAGAALSLHYLLPLAEFLAHAAKRSPEGIAATAARFQVSASYLVNVLLPRLFWAPVPWWPVWTDGWSPWESFQVSIGLSFGLLALFGFRRLWRPSPDAPFVRRLQWMGLGLILLNTTLWGGELLVALHLGSAIPYSRLTQFLLYPLLFSALVGAKDAFANRRELGKLFALFTAALAALLLLSREFSPFARHFFEAAAPFSRFTPESAPALAQDFVAAHRPALSAVLLGAARGLAASLALLALAAVLFHRRYARLVLFASFLLVGLIDTVDFFKSHRQRGTEAYPYTASLAPTNPLLDALHVGDLQNFLFSTYTGWMESETGLAPNLNAVSRVPSVNGYTSFVLKGNSVQPDWYRGNWGYPFSEPVARWLSIRYLLIAPGSEAPAYANRELASFRGYRLMEFPDALPRYFFPRNFPGPSYAPPDNCAAKILSQKGSEILLENSCARNVDFAFSARNYPWWRVRLDGKSAKAFRADPGHEAISVPPGVHRFELICLPLTWYLGIGLSFLTAISLAAVALREARLPRLFTDRRIAEAS